jgi:hypothetical protein
MIEEGKVIDGEVDEEQHKHYGVSCEAARMMNIEAARRLEGCELPHITIRFNPHAFRVDGVSQKISKKQRRERFVEVMREAAATAVRPWTIIYMYYDSVTRDGKLVPCVCDDSEYPEHLKDIVSAIVE